MKYSDINLFCCPECKGNLKFLKIDEFDKDADVSCPHGQKEDARGVREGSIICVHCNSEYPVIKSIPRFTAPDTYASSFGYQWNKFSRTQLDAKQKQISKIRFYATAKWPENLQGQLVLEAGCGAGRFSGVALDTGAEVYSFDLSNAVDACMANTESIEQKNRHHIFQADIYKVPLGRDMFDKIFCFGVLQHCPDVRKAYLSLIPFLKPGGELVVDCYLSQPLKDMFNLKYLLRPVFKWWRLSWLFKLCSVATSMEYDLKAFLVKVPLIGRHIANLVPIGALNYEPEYYFSVSEIKEIKALSMFDMLSPKYDQPQKISDFRSWMACAGLEILELTIGYNGINARGRRPVGE